MLKLLETAANNHVATGRGRPGQGWVGAAEYQASGMDPASDPKPSPTGPEHGRRAGSVHDFGRA